MCNNSNNKRLNIALFINSLHNDYSTSVLKGAAVAAEEMDVNLLIVPGREINARWSEAELNKYEYQHNILYSYLTKNNIDVIIMSLGTFANNLSHQEILDFLNKYTGVKIVIMEQIIPGYPCVLFNNQGLRDAMEHVIKDHGKRKVAFLTGQKGQSVAEERLALYKEILAENDIPYNESYVEYGDFSEWCVDKARNILEKNRDNMPEAIFCANDSMVHAVEKAMDEKGLKIGRDILVTGYDDTEFAGVMDPPLSTVKAYMITMGYEAVSLAVKYCKDSETEIRYIKTAFLKRQSCGCKRKSDEIYDKTQISINLSEKEFSDKILKNICENSSLEFIPDSISGPIRDFIEYIYNCIHDYPQIKFDESVLIDKLDSLFTDNISLFFGTSSYHAMFNVLKQICLDVLPNEKEHEFIHDIYAKIYQKFSSYLASVDIKREERRWLDHFLFARITDEMMSKGKDEDLGFKTMAEVLSYMDQRFKSCYIFNFSEHVLNQKSILSKDPDHWVRPENIYLRSYYDRTGVYVPDKESRKLKSDFFMLNQFVDMSERKTFVLEALYFNEEQYGLAMYESGSRHFEQLFNITKQVCTAIKMTRSTILLENALNEVNKKNEILSRESVSDQLTGLYNRRGFVIESEKIMDAQSGDGFKGAVLFADLDSLKIINDTFGHKNGDFAIRKAASLLRDNLNPTDIISRIGGDEFVAFIPDADNDKMNEICSAVKNMAAEFNKISDKPYNVGVSMGFYCFDSNDGENLEELMMKADRILYENKKLKSKTPIKNLQN